MRITTNQLKKIIKEEMRRVLQEAPGEAELEKLDDEIRKHLIAAERLVAFNSENFQNAMFAYADAWGDFSAKHPEANARAEMAEGTAKRITKMYKDLAASANGILKDLSSLRDDVYVFKSELERGSGRNQ